jgi:transcriptional regulator with XRE-family HTH domain
MYSAMAQRKTISDQVRVEMDRSGLSRYRIAKDTGIDESRLTGFYHGFRRLSVDKLDTLCEYLDLEIRKRKGR